MRETSFLEIGIPCWNRSLCDFGSRRLNRSAKVVKRAGFTTMATLAVHDKAAGNEVFHGYLGRVQAEATDERHGVIAVTGTSRSCRSLRCRVALPF